MRRQPTREDRERTRANGETFAAWAAEHLEAPTAPPPTPTPSDDLMAQIAADADKENTR